MTYSERLAKWTRSTRYKRVMRLWWRLLYLAMFLQVAGFSWAYVVWEKNDGASIIMALKTLLGFPLRLLAWELAHNDPPLLVGMISAFLISPILGGLGFLLLRFGVLGDGDRMDVKRNGG